MNKISSFTQPQSGNGSMVQTGLRSSQKQSANVSMSQNMDLSLKTREGDVVTINAASFSRLNSFTYDETGQMTTDNTSSTSQYSYRSMTLESGSSFTFSVKGELSEQELDDIEKLVGGLDQVIGDMASGNMEGAVETALGMTGYDTVSEFSANISMQSSYTMTTEVSQERYAGNLDSEPAMDAGVNQIDKLMERMMALMEEADKDIQKKSRQPIDQLFGEHLKALDIREYVPDERENLKYQMVADLRDRMQSFFTDIS